MVWQGNGHQCNQENIQAKGWSIHERTLSCCSPKRFDPLSVLNTRKPHAGGWKWHYRFWSFLFSQYSSSCWKMELETRKGDRRTTTSDNNEVALAAGSFPLEQESSRLRDPRYNGSAVSNRKEVSTMLWKPLFALLALTWVSAVPALLAGNEPAQATTDEKPTARRANRGRLPSDGQPKSPGTPLQEAKYWKDALVPLKDEPGLPRVLLIGDSVRFAIRWRRASYSRVRRTCIAFRPTAGRRQNRFKKSTAGSVTATGMLFTSTGACTTCGNGQVRPSNNTSRISANWSNVCKPLVPS